MYKIKIMHQLTTYYKLHERLAKTTGSVFPSSNGFFWFHSSLNLLQIKMGVYKKEKRLSIVILRPKSRWIFKATTLYLQQAIKWAFVHL